MELSITISDVRSPGAPIVFQGDLTAQIRKAQRLGFSQVELHVRDVYKRQVLAIPYLVFLVPIYIMEDILGLLDTNLGLILPYTALNLPLAILIMQNSYREIPSELEDSARIDGANAVSYTHLRCSKHRKRLSQGYVSRSHH